MATEVLLYLVIVLLIMQVVFIGIVINLQMKHKRMPVSYTHLTLPTTERV